MAQAPSLSFLLRPAAVADAMDLAALIDLAGEGIPSWLWQGMAEPGQTPLQVGALRAARTQGGFSYTHATVAERAGKVLGMALSYPLTHESDADDVDSYPAPLRPLVALERLAPHSWYLNAVATDPSHRGQGVARALMAHSAAQGRERGFSTLSLIVASANTSALSLYLGLGWQEQARRPLLPWDTEHTGGDWLLMTHPS